MIIECTSAFETSPGNLGMLGPKHVHPKGFFTAQGWSRFLPEMIFRLRIRSWQSAPINTSILAGVGKGVNLTSQRCSNFLLATDQSTTLLLFAKFSTVQARTVLENLLSGLINSKETRSLLTSTCLST